MAHHFERSDDLGLWAIFSAQTGQSASTPISIPKTGNQGYIKTSYCPVVTTQPFLDFPIKVAGASPSGAPVTAILDHARPNQLVSTGPYNKDHYVRTAQGATYVVLPGDRGLGRDYAALPAHTVVSTLFNYQGVTSQGGKANLQYDGHPGYDYGYPQDTDVYAAAPGTVMTDDDFSGTSLAGSGIATDYMSKYHALILRHDPQGYCTIYMHLHDIDSAYVDRSNPDPAAWKPIKGAVVSSRGAHLGLSGNYDTISAVGYHLHFEVWRLDGGSDWNYSDPYGFYVSNPDNTVVRCYPPLWTGN